jgi:TPR repeat protein
MSKYFRFAADQSSAFGQVNYGVYLLMTRDASKDQAEAARYLKAAADKHDIHGMFNYTLCLFDGKGVPSNRSEAVRLFNSVATGHYSFGEVIFGFCLHEGVSVDRDWLRSVKYFKSAAARGDRVGQFNHGLCCYKGEGVSVNLAEAVEQPKLSADQGYLPARWVYAICHLRDHKVSSDDDQTRVYLDQVGKSHVTKWDQIRRIETPVQVKSLELPWSGKRQTNLITEWKLEMQSFQFIKPFTELAFLFSDECSQRSVSKTVIIQPGVMNEENQSDFEMDIKSFHEIKVLGYGSFGTAKLMSDIYSEQFAVKYFNRGIPHPDKVRNRSFPVN